MAGTNTKTTVSHCIDFTTIPTIFKTERVFLCWRFGPVQTNGKRTKIPIDRSGKAINPVAPTLWRTCFETIGQMEAGHADGIGIGLQRSQGIIGIDLDDSVVEGVIQPWALPIMATCPNTYWEYSPSGNGLHGFVLGTLPEGHRTDTKTADGHKVEVYSNLRYLTYTGNRLPDAGAEVQPAAESFYQWFGKTFTIPATSVADRIVQPLQPLTLDDAALVARIRTSAKGDTFSRLFDGTDISTDDSRNDIKLVGILAYWTGKNPERMDSLYRTSALYRDKWDRKTGETTYGQRTISKAIANCLSVVESGWKPDQEKREGVTQRESQVTCAPPVRMAATDARNPDLDGLPVNLLPMGLTISGEANAKEIQAIIRALYRGHHRVVNRDRFRIGDACNALKGNSGTKAKQLRAMGFNDGDIQFFNTCSWVSGQFPDHKDREAAITWSAFVALAKKEFSQADREHHITRKSSATHINTDRAQKLAASASEPHQSPEAYALALFQRWVNKDTLPGVITKLKALVDSENHSNHYENSDENAITAQDWQEAQQMFAPLSYEEEPDFSHCVSNVSSCIVAPYENDMEHTRRDADPDAITLEMPVIQEAITLALEAEHIAEAEDRRLYPDDTARLLLKAVEKSYRVSDSQRADTLALVHRYALLLHKEITPCTATNFTTASYCPSPGYSMPLMAFRSPASASVAFLPT